MILSADQLYVAIRHMPYAYSEEHTDPLAKEKREGRRKETHPNTRCETNELVQAVFTSLLRRKKITTGLLLYKAAHLASGAIHTYQIHVPKRE